MTGHRGGSARFISADISESTLRFLSRAQYPLPCTQFIAVGVGRGGGGRERKGSSCKVGRLFLLIPVLLCLPLPFSAPPALLSSPCPPLPPPALLCLPPLSSAPSLDPSILSVFALFRTKMRLPDKIQFGSWDTYRVCARYKARSPALSPTDKHAQKQIRLCILMVNFRKTIEKKSFFQHAVFWDIFILT